MTVLDNLGSSQIVSSYQVLSATRMKNPDLVSHSRLVWSHPQITVSNYM